MYVKRRIVNRRARLRLAGLAACAALAAGCDSPTSPSSTNRPSVYNPPARYDVRPVEAEFQDAFWRQIAFDGRPEDNVTRALRNTSPNLYIRMGDPTERRVVSYQQRDHMRRAFPRLVRQITGQSYGGAIQDGIDDYAAPGWITVRFVTEEEEPDITFEACGRASIGADPGNIWIVRRARGNKNCIGGYSRTSLPTRLDTLSACFTCPTGMP